MFLDRIISISTGKTVYKDGENCVKLYYLKSQAEVYEEAYKQVLVYSLGVSVPQIKGIEKIVENQAIIAEFVKGEILEKLFFATDEKSLILQQLIDFQKKYHKIHTDKLPTGRKIFKSEILKCPDEKFRKKALKLLNETQNKNELCHAGFDFSELLTLNENYIRSVGKIVIAGTSFLTLLRLFLGFLKNTVKVWRKVI